MKYETQNYCPLSPAINAIQGGPVGKQLGYLIEGATDNELISRTTIGSAVNEHYRLVFHEITVTN